jgi:hypothetical protein
VAQHLFEAKVERVSGPFIHRHCVFPPRVGQPKRESPTLAAGADIAGLR